MTGEEFLQIGSVLRIWQIEIEARLSRLGREGKASGDPEFDRLSVVLTAVTERLTNHMEQYQSGR